MTSVDTERAIERVLHSVAYILDAGEYDRMGEVFHEDVIFSNPGRLEAQGPSTLAEVDLADADPGEHR